MPDSIYSLTRRAGVPVTVVTELATTVNPATGEKSVSMTPINVRLAVKSATSYARIIAAQAAQRAVGDTQFVFWTGDVDFRELQSEDYIVTGGERFQVVSCEVAGTGVVVTARRVQGTAAPQVVSLDVANTLTGTQDTDIEVT